MQATSGQIPYKDKAAFYKELISELKGLSDPVWYTHLANASALLKQHLPNVNWAGFYLARAKSETFELVLGPFQGLPACVRIDAGRGVCGTAALTRKSLIVADVDAYPGHIACDSASRSEIVVPLVVGARLIGVMDVDSPTLNRFDEFDQIGLEEFAKVLLSSLDWPAVL
jgi:L-methionine (R)-S-oxide reductase